MRLSVYEYDPGYQPWLDTRQRRESVRVFLDGVEQDDVVTADDQEGFIVRSKHDDNGCRFVEDDDIATERMSGDVVIMVEPNTDAL